MLENSVKWQLSLIYSNVKFLRFLRNLKEIVVEKSRNLPNFSIFICHVYYFCWQSVGIEVRVTNEIPVSAEPNIVRDALLPWTTTSVSCRTTPPTPTNPHPQYLSPHVFHGRNSLCSANGKFYDYRFKEEW